MKIPSLHDVYLARNIVRNHLPPTPLHHYPALDELVGSRVLVKHENYQPIGAFKVRGGINLISQLSEDEKRRGVSTASTGNHGQSIAYACRIFGVRAVIFVPENANPVKVAAMRSHGAEIVFYGKDFDEARVQCEVMAREKGLRFISSGDEPLLISGVGTHTLEIIEVAPDVEMIIVPIGGGSGAAGACLVAKGINPAIQVIGVQASQAPAAYLTWKNRKHTEAEMRTTAEGLATRAPFMLPQQILWQYLDDFLLVEDDEMMRSVVHLLERAKTLAEPSAASTLAAALRIPERVKGKTIALILSGGNIAPQVLAECLRRYSQQSPQS